MNMKNKAIVALPVSGTLKREIRRAAKETRLSQAAVMRQSILLGLPQFVRQFPQPAARRSNGKGQFSRPATA